MTIRHVVMWKLASSDPAERTEQLARITSGLRSLPETIPELLNLEVGVDTVGSDNFDVALISEFADADALARYIAHPDHQRVSGYIRSVVGGRSAVDFEI